MANTRQELGKAFELIRQDQLEEAIAIVKPITEAEPENADAWWLLANAASEPRDARRALVNVLKINPSYPKARDLLDKLSELHPPRDDELMMMMEIADVEPTVPGGEAGDPFEELEADDPFQASEDAPTSDIDELFSETEDAVTATFDDDFGLGDEDPFADLLAADEEKEAKAGRRRRRRRERSGGGGRTRRILLLLILIIIIGGAAAFVLMGGDETTEEDEPEVAENTGGTFSLDPVAPETVNAENAEQLESVRSAVESDAQAQVSPEASAFYIQVPDGYSLLVRVCAEPTVGLRDVAIDGMELAARRVGNTPIVQGDLTMVGVSIHDCAHNNDTLYRAMSPMAAVTAFAPTSPNNPAALANFQQSWVIER